MFRKLQGQLTLEYLGTLLLFITTLGVLAFSILEPVDAFKDQTGDYQKNLEAKRITDELITTTGINTSNDREWRQGDDLKTIGLSETGNEFLTVKSDKLKALNSINNPQSPGNKITYNQFTNISGINNQYLFNFTWVPTIKTFKNFQKESPPQKPFIREPTGSDYDTADDRVHYGNTSLNGTEYNFLVVSHNLNYDQVYINTSWDFRGVNPIETGQTNNLPGNMRLKIIQNLEKKPGAILIFERHEKTFGATRDPNAETFKFNRYPIYIDDQIDNHPMRIEVLVW